MLKKYIYYLHFHDYTNVNVLKNFIGPRKYVRYYLEIIITVNIVKVCNQKIVVESFAVTVNSL